MSVARIQREAKKDESVEEQAESAPPPEALSRPARTRRLLRLGGSALLLLVVVGVVGHWLFNRWTHVYVDDSRIAADVITVSSEVAGRGVVLDDAVLDQENAVADAQGGFDLLLDQERDAAAKDASAT